MFDIARAVAGALHTNYLTAMPLFAFSRRKKIFT